MEEGSEVVVDKASAEPEKTLSVTQVNDIVKREKAAAAEKVRRELEALHAKELEALQAEKQKSGNIAGEQGSSENIEDKVFNRILERAKAMEVEEQKKIDADQLKRAADQYFLKVGAGKDKFSDFEEVMQDFDPSAFPQTSLLAGSMENTADIMYELAKNPFKLAQLEELVSRSPKLAQKELQKLAQSITQNDLAKAENTPTNAPLSRLKSPTVGGDSGKMTLKDLKSANWLRG